MTTEISNAFVKQFESEIHLEYQRMGSAIRNTVRTKNGVTGESTTFQVAGTGSAGGKDRHGNIPTMNASRSPVECTLSDRYGSEYIDSLDELKIQHDERFTVAQTVSGALGRDTDDILFTAMDATANPNNSATAVTWTTAAAPMVMMEAMGKSDVPFDGNLYACVPWDAWSALLGIDEFSNSDYVGDNKLWHEGVTAKDWIGFKWFPHSGLPDAGTDEKKMFFWHERSLGHAIGADVSMYTWFNGDKDAWRVTGKMSHGATLIDDTGCIELTYDVS